MAIKLKDHEAGAPFAGDYKASLGSLQERDRGCSSPTSSIAARR